jgi:putative oxidoreductase
MMMNQSQRKTLESTGILAGRSLIGFMFMFSGFGMFMSGADAVGGYFGSVGVPFPMLSFYIVVIAKMVAGAALILGYRVGLMAGALILFTLGATYFGHRDLSDEMNQIMVLKNLAIIGGLLYVMAFGAGSGWKLGR